MAHHDRNEEVLKRSLQTPDFESFLRLNNVISEQCLIMNNLPMPADNRWKRPKHRPNYLQTILIGKRSAVTKVKSLSLKLW